MKIFKWIRWEIAGFSVPLYVGITLYDAYLKYYVNHDNTFYWYLVLGIIAAWWGIRAKWSIRLLTISTMAQGKLVQELTKKLKEFGWTGDKKSNSVK
jgi:hypothetical protein